MFKGSSVYFLHLNVSFFLSENCKRFKTVKFAEKENKNTFYKSGFPYFKIHFI